MDNQNKEEKGCLETAIEYLIDLFFKALWYGTVKAIKRNKKYLILYAVLIVLTVLAGLIFDDVAVAFMIDVIVFTAFVIGVIEYIKAYPEMKRDNEYQELFREINLVATDGTVPFYLREKKISDYASMLVFSSYVPLSNWLAKKELLEIHMNEKIIDIKQGDSLRITNVITKTKNLPKRIDWSDNYINKKINVLYIGTGYYGIAGINLETNAHAFVAGETGSGKSNILKCLIHQALIKNYEVILIDFKRGVSFASFGEVAKIYYEYSTILQVLKEMVIETKNRLDKFRKLRVESLKDYNKISGSYLPRKIIFIDELAELLKTRDKELSRLLYDSIESLTRLSRAVGIHLIMGLQRPDSTIVSGQIKNNVTYRACGRFIDKEPSKIMLNTDMASRLPNIKGRFILKDDNLNEVQCFYYQEDKSAVVPKAIEKTGSMEVAETKQEPKATEQVPPMQEPKKEEIAEPSEFTFDFSDILKRVTRHIKNRH